MNDIQEDKFSMYLKVTHFLGVNVATLAVNPLFASLKTALDTRIAAITAQDVIAQTNIKGYTEAKNDAEAELENSVLHVARGLRGYYAGLGNKEMVRKVEMSKTDVVQSRDGNLNTQAEIIHGIADPVKALLAPHEVAPADVDALETNRLAFVALFSVPREKQGDGKAAREEMERLFSITDDETLAPLDAQMAVYESVNPVLFSKYDTARMIDNSGGGSGSEGYELHNYTVPAGGLVQFLTPQPEPDREIYLRNLSDGGVFLCSTDGTTGPCAAGYILNGHTIVKTTYGTLGLNPALPIVQFSNNGSEDVLVRAGLKTV